MTRRRLWYAALVAAVVVATTTIAAFVHLRRGSTSEDSESTIDYLRRVMLAKADLTVMTPEERERFCTFVDQTVKWKTGELSADQLQAFLGWDARQLEASFVAGRTTFNIGDEPRFAATLRNTSHRSQVVFAFRRGHISERGEKKGGKNLLRVTFDEEPLQAPYLQIVPARGSLVVPLLLTPEPPGEYIAELALRLSRFVDISDVRALEHRTLATKTVHFEIREAD